MKYVQLGTYYMYKVSNLSHSLEIISTVMNKGTNNFRHLCPHYISDRNFDGINDRNDLKEVIIALHNLTKKMRRRFFFENKYQIHAFYDIKC